MSTPQRLFEKKGEVTVIGNCTSGSTTTGTGWSVYQGGAAEVLRELEKESVSCVITSPPYYWLRDYGVDDQIGREETVAEYVDSIASVMDEVYRVLKRNGLLFLNLGDTYYSGKGKPKGAAGFPWS